MLSFIGVQWSASLVLAIIGCFLAGGLCGLGSVRLALSYVGLLAKGHPPDSASLWLAIQHLLTNNSPDQGQSFLATKRFTILFVFLMGSLSLALLLRYGQSVYFLALLCAATLLLTLAIIDTKTGLLPDALTLPLLWGGLIMAWWGAATALPDAVVGAALGYLVPWCLYMIYKYIRQVDVMGHGDFKLLAALGAWLGWQTVAPILLLASLSLLLVAAWHQKSLRPAGAYPFGPFLILAAVAVFVDQSALHLHF